MKRLSISFLLVLVASLAFAAERGPAFLSPVQNAQYVYVTSFDGPQFSPNLWPEDRQAIENVETMLQKSGRYIIVYRPQGADMIVAVESRPSEDVLAIYDKPSWRDGDYLWRATGKDGLSSPGVPLVKQFETALAQLKENKLG